MCHLSTIVNKAKLVLGHSRPKRPCSYWSAARIATSGISGKVQHQKSAIHGLPVTLRMLGVKSDKSDWLRVRNEFFAHAQKIGPGQRSRFLVLIKRSAASASGDENGPRACKTDCWNS